MKLKKWLLGLVTFTAMVVICAVCAGAETYGDYEYSVLNDGTVEITDYNGSAEKVDIPEKINGKSVTRIGDEAFSGNSSFTSVTIPDGVTSIGEDAFYYCINLVSVKIPSSITSIGWMAFKGCTSLTSVIIPDGVTGIGWSTFEGCISLISVTIPDSVTYIDSQAFKDCTLLASIKIPDSVTGIYNEAFLNCTSLKSVTIPASVTTIDESAFESCISLTNVTISGGVTKINCRTFYNCTSLTNITIPNGVIDICESAFYGCSSLTSVIIPDSVTQIADLAFFNCTSLKSVTIPASVTWIGNYALGYQNYTKMDNFKLQYTKNSVGHLYAAKEGFTDEACLAAKELDNGTLSIVGYVGYDKNYTIPSEIEGKKVTEIGDNAFENSTTLTSVTISEGVTSIGYRSFEGCTSLISITIPDSVTDICGYAFEDCTSLKSATIPTSAEYIGDYTFFNCTSLKSVTIPASVTDIGEYAFGYCYDVDNWTHIKVDGFTINYTKNTYGHFYATKNGFSDEACLSTKELDDGTLCITGYVGNVTTFIIPSEINDKKVAEIEKSAFANNIMLTSVTIPDGVTSIGRSAFEGCTSLISIIIPDSVTYIDQQAFKDCISLTNVTIPNNITKIVDKTFFNCTSLKSVTIPTSVTDIGNYAFEDCSSLKAVTIPASVTNIGNYAIGYYYDDNTGYTRIDSFKISYTKNTYGHYYATKNGFSNESCFLFTKTIDDDNTLSIKAYVGNDKMLIIPSEIDGKKVTEIGYGVFAGNTTLTSVTIPDGMIRIGDKAFEGCISLTSIKIPDSVTEIDNEAFLNCTSVKSVKIPETVANIQAYAFGYCCDSNWNYTKVNDFDINYAKNTYGHYYAYSYGFTNEPCKLVARLCSDGTMSIIYYVEYDKKTFTIPSEINGKKVTSIEDSAFSRNGVLTNITIPDSVNYIGWAAFSDCTSLESITIPSSVIRIEAYAFEGCTSLKSATIPTSAEYIGDYAFEDCTSLKSVTIPAGVFHIGKYAFGYYHDDDNVDFIKVDDFKIYYYVSGTSGEQYAKENEFEYELIDCIEHDYDDWEIIEEATCTINGKKFRVCAVCGKIEIAEITATGHQYTKTVVAPTYTSTGYTLYKCSVCGYSYKDNETAKLTLAKVTSFKVKSLTSTNVTLQWNKNANASGYEIEQYKDGKWVNVAKITGNATTSYTVKGLKAGTAGYQFRIRAYRTEGKNKAYSGYSATVKVNTNPYGVGGFKCSSKSSTSVTLKWNKGTTASGYQLQQYKDGKWVTIYTGTKATDTSYTVKKLKAGTAGYRFRIRAYKTYGNTKQYGSWSSEVKVNTNPYGVGGFKCSSKTSTSVTLKWNKGTTASGYQLQQYKDGKWVTIYTGTKATNTSYTVKGLKAGTAGYRFRIRAYKTYGNTKQYGSWSSEVKVNTNPYGVGGFKAKSTAKNTITLGWNKGTTASGYQLQQYKGGKWVTVYTGTKATSTRCTVKSLKSNTSYKFRIRAYKTYGNTKQYGSWSSTLTVKTKK